MIFRLDAGQTVPPHSSDSSVLLTVVRGPGYVSGSMDGEVKETAVDTGVVVTYLPNEVHGMRAGARVFIVVATIAPRPGVARASLVA